jgi:hypothetical protein
MLGYAKVDSDYDNIPHPRFAITTVKGDIDHDGDVDMNDFRILARAWSSRPGDAGWNPAADIADPQDNVIDLNDLNALLDGWLDWL